MIALKFFIYRYRYYIIHVRECNQQEKLEWIRRPFTYNDPTYTFQLSFFKIMLLAWGLPGLLTVLFQTIILGGIVEIRVSGILELTQRYSSLHGILMLMVDV